MDVYCPKCGEPWDVSCFHDARPYDMTERAGKHFRERFAWRLANTDDAKATARFMAVKDAFFRFGCGEVFCASPCERTDSLRAEVSRELSYVLGDDVDGIAAMLEDFYL